ncbi:MAG: UvrD-helicase domain-containing protein [Clostridia bacterium]|nr:UvrD-helicase domain-containing protein [Clostridia bacterium]
MATIHELERERRYNTAKRALFDKLYSSLNSKQREAVYTINGPLLVLAGAGSGKTTVLVERIGYIIRYGNAYKYETPNSEFTDEDIMRLERAINAPKEEIAAVLESCAVSPCPPWSVLAITFTKKAAGEMKERLEKMLGPSANEVWAGTFHSVCVRLLRRFGSQIGLDNNFTIYDETDSLKLMSTIMKERNIDDKVLPAKNVLNVIGRLKDKLTTPEEFALQAEASRDFGMRRTAELYREYAKRLKGANAVDFDDIIMRTVELLSVSAEVREFLGKRFRYISVDEYQDTNYAQFMLASLIAGGRRNLMVVGDDDQSIYRFRGATIENILNFDRTYADAQVIKLEQNYRSTSVILDAANAVIANNTNRKGKELWTSKEGGEKITLAKLDDQNEEGYYVADMINSICRRQNKTFGDFAVLYRTRAQSNALEKAFVRAGVKYYIVGDTRFYDRKEIKDIMAYLQLVSNPDDNIRLMRIINVPRRKIGETTVDAVAQIAAAEGRSMFAVIKDSAKYTALSKSAKTLTAFADLIEALRREACNKNLPDFVESVLDMTGYLQMLRDGGEAEAERCDNARELISNALEYANEVLGGDIAPDPLAEEEPTATENSGIRFTSEEAEKTKAIDLLGGFLEDVALVSDVDKLDENAQAVVLMTVHSAKGLEFPVVFLTGMEEGLFPGYRSQTDMAELEEERRLAYVAITRAKEKLYITYAKNRMLFGRTQFSTESQFVKEIPQNLIESNLSMREKASEIEAVQTAQARKTFDRTTVKPKANEGGEQFAAGDCVRHKIFGKGIVLSATKMGPDVLYEVAFDTVGTKKLMGSYVKMTKE